MKIMYVEDNPANLFLVKRIARQGGHDVINFVDGNEALKNFHETAPDLVLMDVQLSGEINGLQVVERLRQQGVSTPIIAVTAYAMVGDRERCMEAGCDDYIAKPIPIARLLEIFERYSKRIPTPHRFRTSTSEIIAVDANASHHNSSNHRAAPAAAPAIDKADEATATVDDEPAKADAATADMPPEAEPVAESPAPATSAPADPPAPAEAGATDTADTTEMSRKVDLSETPTHPNRPVFPQAAADESEGDETTATRPTESTT